MRYSTIDLDDWYRCQTYRSFAHYTNPTVSMTSRIDVTDLYRRCKNVGSSFFTDLLYVVSVNINDIEEMRLRIKDDDVILYDSIDPGIVVMKDDNSITNSRIEMTHDYEEFRDRVTKGIEAAKRCVSKENMNRNQASNIFFNSSMHWVDFTSINHPLNFADKESCSIPRITWGKITEQSGRLTVAFDVCVHHALIDGYHIGKCIMGIQKDLNDLHLFG